jgi:hypothetical protein
MVSDLSNNPSVHRLAGVHACKVGSTRRTRSRCRAAALMPRKEHHVHAKVPSSAERGGITPGAGGASTLHQFASCERTPRSTQEPLSNSRLPYSMTTFLAFCMRVSTYGRGKLSADTSEILRVYGPLGIHRASRVRCCDRLGILTLM